ncbi:uncharacterized protein LOC130407860 isoform X1 [Triplophysa dalaica]|uniref:uncharacterized protein LOC130407860 isoform X1 n=2 Tax=Triplophysa dalaica TaxID=1582913 RepID=UPI0024E02467|nr:uncharacterized protein LOC130407860 isoform X1 [Triplophysa dalaica]
MSSDLHHPSPHRQRMVVSAKCAFHFEHKSCMALVLYTPPSASDFVLMKGAISNIQCRRSSCRCDRDALSELQQREGSFFLPFDGGLRTLCVLTPTPDFPPTPTLFEYGAEEEAVAFVCLWMEGDSLHTTSFQPSDTALLQPSGPRLYPTAQLATIDKLSDLTPGTRTKTFLLRPGPAPSGEAEEGCEPAAIFKSHNNVWQIELHFVNSCQHGPAKHSLDLVLI